MTTKLIAYHPKDRDFALFVTNGEYWIGVFSASLTHQTGEPLYIRVEDVCSEEEGRMLLSSRNPWEFD